MDQQPFINNGYYNNQVNEYPSQQEINTAPYSDNNNNNPPPPNEYLAQPINTQNNYPPLQIEAMPIPLKCYNIPTLRISLNIIIMQ